MRTRIAVVLICLTCLCAPQADLNHRQSPAEEILLNCAALTPEDSSDSNKVGLAISMAEIYLETGQKAKAFETLSQAVEKSGLNDPKALGESLISDFLAPVASLYARAGQPDRALSLAHKIVRPSARAEALARVASALLESGQTERVPGLLSQALKQIKPADDARAALDLIATAYAKMGECDSALKAAEIILPEDEYSRASTLSAAATECAKAGRKDKASAIISRALRAANSIKARGRSKDDDEDELGLKAEALAEIAAALVDLGEPDKAASILSQAAQIVKPSPENMFELGKIAAAYAKAGRYAQATEIASSIKYGPSHAQALSQIAREHIKAGNNQAAIHALTQALDLARKFDGEVDQSQMDTLTELAYEFARAGDKRKASEILLYALKETRAADEDDQPDLLVEIVKVYARARLEIDAEAKVILQKICAGEPIPPTPEETAKRKRAEEAADRFIQRWHETLDMNVLFDEMYVTNAEQRRRNVSLFYGVYKFLTASAGPAVDKDIDEKLMREGFMAFWNLYYMTQEYDLAFGKSGAATLTLPHEFSEARKNAKWPELDEKRMSAAPIGEYVAVSNYLASLLRKYFRPEVFDTDLYRQNINSYLARQGKESERFRIAKGFSHYGVGKDVEVYVVKRGLFDFYFIEEKGELRVLTLGFDL